MAGDLDLALRLAGPDDRDVLLEWRNDPTTFAHFARPAPVGSTEHVSWFESALAADDVLMLVAELGGEPIGIVRFDRRDPSTWEISITVAPSRRGTGLGRVLLSASLRTFRARTPTPHRVLARVHPENVASIRLFEQSGFVLEDSDAEFLTWVRDATA